MSFKAITINVDTGPVTALALLSLQRYCSYPITLIDCSKRASEQTYAWQLADHLGITLEQRPLKPHGKTLDDLFYEANEDYVLLLDSDAELLDGQIVSTLDLSKQCSKCFGSGFVHVNSDMSMHGIPYAWYASRMWVPCCMLDVRHIKGALNAGISFDRLKIYNDLPDHRILSRILSLRHYLPGGQHLALTFLDRFRQDYFGVKPSYIYFDTGALVYAYLRQQCYRFHQLDWSLQQQSVAHYHGVTRNRLNWFDNNSTRRKVAIRQAMQRIREHYPGCLPQSLMR